MFCFLYKIKNYEDRVSSYKISIRKKVSSRKVILLKKFIFNRFTLPCFTILPVKLSPISFENAFTEIIPFVYVVPICYFSKCVNLSILKKTIFSAARYTALRLMTNVYFAFESVLTFQNNLRFRTLMPLCILSGSWFSEMKCLNAQIRALIIICV